MKIKLINSYNRHGCNMHGNLGLIEYWDSPKNTGRFSSMSCFDALDDAKALMETEYPNATILLGVPDLVFRID